MLFETDLGQLAIDNPIQGFASSCFVGESHIFTVYTHIYTLHDIFEKVVHTYSRKYCCPFGVWATSHPGGRGIELRILSELSVIS